jgi:hypothetical protein
MKCQLCSNEYAKLADAHILPIGFFKNIPTKGRVDTVSLDGEKGRKLQKAIYDKEILCASCERDIVSPLDDYGIKIFRDRLNSFFIEIPNRPADKLIIYESIDPHKLKAFLASILWRISVSKQKELRDLLIGETYEKRIANDLLSKSNGFGYIDASVRFLSDPRHMAFMLPYKKRIGPIDTKRDSQAVNGWVMQFPNISITVSLDKRPHPHRMYTSISSDLSNRSEDILASTSLLAKENGYSFMAIETDKDETTISQMITALRNTKVKSI